MEINEIIPNTNPMNKGSDYGNDMIFHSIKLLGLGRSIVVDKNNIVISGDKVLNQCKKIGIKKLHVIETTGDTLIVVKRIDVKSTDKTGLLLSLVDNLSNAENLDWNADNVENNMNTNLGFNPIEWGGDACCVKDLEIETLLNENVVKSNPKTPKDFKEPIQLSLFEDYE